MSIAQSVTDESLSTTAANGVTLVDFWAPWCAPCKAMSPIIDELAGELEGQVKVVKADLEANPKNARNAGVRGIPAFALMKDGKTMSVKTGKISKEALRSWINEMAA